MKVNRQPAGARIAFGLAILSATLTAQSATAPLPYEFVRIGTLVVGGDSVPLATIARALGTAPIADTGQGHSRTFSTCYAGGAGAAQYTLTFEADAEMGGPDRRVSSIVLRAGGPSRGTQCAPLAAALTARTDRGITLGLRRDSVIALLGRPAREQRGVATYTGHHTKPNRSVSCPVYDATSHLSIRYRDARVVEVRGTRTDTC